MTRDELTAALQSARAQLDAALAALGEAELTTPGPDGLWSVKDVLAHITACEVDLLTNLGKVRRGQKPGQTAWTDASVQAQNERWFAEFKDRPLERVLADFDGVHAQLLRQAAASSDEELMAPAAWLQGRPLYQYFLDEVISHEAEHAAELVKWRRPGQV